VNFKNYKKLRMKFWLDLFEEFDFDKNGMINFTEFNAVLQHCGSGLTDEEIVKIFLRDLLGVGINKEDVGTSINKEEVPLQALLDFMEAKTGRSQNFLDIKQCGRCHAKFETGKGTLAFDRDIITHLALCYGIASARKVEDFLLGGFLTESYAQRKWFSRLATRITFGKYEVGKNNGNILIKDRRTGQIIEEKMPVYIRMGIRLLYQSIAGKEGRFT
jgi:phosphatidylserine decarboxylase